MWATSARNEGRIVEIEMLADAVVLDVSKEAESLLESPAQSVCYQNPRIITALNHFLPIDESR